MREGGLEEIRAGWRGSAHWRALGHLAALRLQLAADSGRARDRCRGADRRRARGASPRSLPAGIRQRPREVDDEIDLARARIRSLAALLVRAPTRDLLDRVRGLKGDASPLGLAHIALAEAPRAGRSRRSAARVLRSLHRRRRGELLPYASYYLTGFLHERPLARVRRTQAGSASSAPRAAEPEDHLAILCEVMAACARCASAPSGCRPPLLRASPRPWAPRFFADLETAKRGRFYRRSGAVGRALHGDRGGSLRDGRASERVQL